MWANEQTPLYSTVLSPPPEDQQLWPLQCKHSMWAEPSQFRALSSQESKKHSFQTSGQSNTVDTVGETAQRPVEHSESKLPRQENNFHGLSLPQQNPKTCLLWHWFNSKMTHCLSTRSKSSPRTWNDPSGRWLRKFFKPLWTALRSTKKETSCSTLPSKTEGSHKRVRSRGFPPCRAGCFLSEVLTWS